MSISPTVHEQLFYYKSVLEACMLRFVFFWRDEIVEKAACKISILPTIYKQLSFYDRVLSSFYLIEVLLFVIIILVKEYWRKSCS